MPKTFRCGLNPGDWVRVLRNEVGAMSPYRDGQYIQPYEAVKIAKLEVNSPNRGSQETIHYLVGRSMGFIPAADVEKIHQCVCARPVLKACGCKCGYQQMIDAEAAKAAKKRRLPPDLEIPPPPPVFLPDIDIDIN